MPYEYRPRTRVVNLQYGARLGRDFDVYIGRACFGYPASPFANPHGIGHGGIRTREQAIAAFRADLHEQPDLVARIRAELEGKVLGCWCAPHPCHGDVLAVVAMGGPL